MKAAAMKPNHSEQNPEALSKDMIARLFFPERERAADGLRELIRHGSEPEASGPQALIWAFRRGWMAGIEHVERTGTFSARYVYAVAVVFFLTGCLLTWAAAMHGRR